MLRGSGAVRQLGKLPVRRRLPGGPYDGQADRAPAALADPFVFTGQG
jgi:hypothetical protein